MSEGNLEVMEVWKFLQYLREHLHVFVVDLLRN